MNRVLALLLALGCVAADWQTAEPGWSYEFPRDHRTHAEFKTEWWYFTGNLFDENGARFGYELTFFRQGILPPNERQSGRSRFLVEDLKFAHFTITDVAGKRFRFTQKTSRGAFGEAGFDEGERLAWIDDWSLKLLPNGRFVVEATLEKAAALRLELAPATPPVIHGENGVSAKAAEPGHASHYYSFPRLATAGELMLEGRKHALQGESWFDHEWATNQLAPGQVGWDWLSVQLEDGRALMLYRMRLADGTEDPSSSGTLIAADGSATHLQAGDFTMLPAKIWKSGRTGAKYPVGWRVEIPAEKLSLEVQPTLEDQELALLPLAYWEGAIDVRGTSRGQPLQGRGYLELTGYAAPLQELQR